MSDFDPLNGGMPTLSEFARWAPSSSSELAARSLAAAVGAGVQIDPEALQISPDLWAVHGTTAYDGEIIVAEFDDLDSARRAVRWAVSFNHERPQLQ